MGYSADDYLGRPAIGIFNTRDDLTHCHAHFKQRVEDIKRGILQAGGFPLEIPAMALSESFLKPTSMLYRNFLSMQVEEWERANPIDGVVLMGGCDKTTPALLMGAISAGLPAIYFPAGPMLRGNWHGQVLGRGSDAWKYWDEKRAGLITIQDWEEIENGIARSCGVCMTMGTAATMTSMAEVMGMSLPGASSIPAADANHQRLAAECGRRVVSWISDEEKDYLATTLAAEKSSNSDVTRDIRAYGRLLRDKNLWLLIALPICYTSGQYRFSIWLPTLVKSLTGQNLTTVGWLTALPYLTALGGLYLFGAWNDMTRNPKLCTVLSLIGFGLCFWLATLFPLHPWVSVALLVLTGFFTKAMQAPFWVFPPLLFPPGLCGGSRGIINALGNLGGFLGPSLMGWLAAKTGDLRLGILALSLLQALSAGLTALLPRVTSQDS